MIESPEPETPNPEPQTSITQPIAADLKAPEFGSSLDDETIADEIFNGEETLQAIEGLGEIPKESRKGLSKKSFVLDTLLNFFSSEKESPDRIENTLEGTIGGSINDQVDVNNQPKVEDTTGFKMPEFGNSLEEEPKAIEESPVGVLSAPPILKEKILTDKIAAKSDDLARIYNASPTETERSGWSNNGKERYKKYREGNLKEIYRGVEDKSEEAETNITALKKTLDNYKETFSYDLKAANVSFEDFKEYMILAYGSETIFGTYKNSGGNMVSGTGVVGELQVTRPTLLGDWKRDRNKNKELVNGKGTWIHGVIGGQGSNKNFGPNMAKKLGFTIKLIKAEPELDRNIAMSAIPKERKRYVLVKDGLAHTVADADAKIKKLLIENQEFSFMAGTAVMLNKLQGQT